MEEYIVQISVQLYVLLNCCRHSCAEVSKVLHVFVTKLINNIFVHIFVTCILVIYIRSENVWNIYKYICMYR